MVVPKIITEIGCNYKGGMFIVEELIMSVVTYFKVNVATFLKICDTKFLTPFKSNVTLAHAEDSYGFTCDVHRESFEHDLDQNIQSQGCCKDVFAENLPLIIFFQAAADFSYIIQLYNKYKGKRDIYLFVINVENNYKFVKSLDLDLKKLVFIPYYDLSLKRVYRYITQAVRVRFLWNKYMRNFDSADVVFFSCAFDWMTAYFVKKLSLFPNNRVFTAGTYNNYDNIFYKMIGDKLINVGLTVRKKIDLLLLYMMTGIKFVSWKEFRGYVFPYYDYPIKKRQINIDVEVLNLYKYKIKKSNNKSVIFFPNPWVEEGKMIEEQVDKEMADVIIELKRKGYKVIVKGHPRLGLPKVISDVCDDVIPLYIPAEFVDFTGVDLILGFTSTSIVFYSKNSTIPTYSLINFIHSADQRKLDEHKKILISMAGDGINIPKSMEEF